MRTSMSEENIGYWMNLHGYVPWTAVIADHLKDGVEWDPENVAKHLWTAQDKIDRLTEELVALKTEKTLKEASGK